MARYNYKTQRLYVDAPLSGKVEVEADRNQANYLLNVLRMTEGSDILLFNARDGEWLARVKPTSRRKCFLVCEEQVRSQPADSTLQYLFAPLKQGRLDYMVQKAVEMGAGVLRPVITQHTHITKLNLRRMEANVIEASEQCGILSVPRVEPPVKLPSLLADWNDNRTLVFCDEATGDEDVVKCLEGIRTSELAVLVGPEGGFSEEERDLLNSCRFVVPIPLGPRILRADTAAVAALTLVQATIGDW